MFDLWEIMTSTLSVFKRYINLDSWNHAEQRYHKSEQFLNWVIISLTFETIFHVGHFSLIPMEYFLLLNGSKAQNYKSFI